MARPIGSAPGIWWVNWGPQDESEAVRAIHAALDAGVNWIDTAPFYGWGRAEEIVGRAIRGLAGIPKSPQTAIALIAVFGVLTSLLSWGLSLIFGGLLAREMAQRVKGLDYRAAGAAGYLGLGTVSMLDR